ncbi:MAG: hypothetical protein EOP08_11235, partial [Proteobacteria bacterium]
MPLQERRRQRRAYRKGVFRTAAYSATVLAAVGSLAVVALQNSTKAERSARIAAEQRDRARANESRALAAEENANRLASSRAEALREVIAERKKAVRLAEERRVALERAKAAEAAALAQSRLAREQSVRADRFSRTALVSARIATEQRVRADRQARAARSSASVAERESARAYASTVLAASSMLEPVQSEAVAPLLGSLRLAREKWKGWEYGHLTAAVASKPSLAVVGPPVKVDSGAGAIGSVALSGDGKRLITGGSDGRLILSDPSTGRPTASVAAFGSPTAVRAMAAFGDGVAAVGDSGWVGVVDVSRARVRWSTSIAGANLRAVAASPDGRLVLAAGTGGFAALLDAETGKVVRTSLTGNLGSEDFVSVAFVPRGNFITFGATSGHVTVAGRDFTSRSGFDAKGPISSLAWSPSGTELAASGPFGLSVWDTATLV